MPPDAVLRRALGRLTAAFGVLHLAPVAFVWLSALGPAPITVTARAWSLFFYGHFIAFVASGYGLQLAAAARSKLFHGGPMIDFTLGLVGFMLLESFGAAGVRGLLPGIFLIGFGTWLSLGRPLLSSPNPE